MHVQFILEINEFYFLKRSPMIIIPKCLRVSSEFPIHTAIKLAGYWADITVACGCLCLSLILY